MSDLQQLLRTITAQWAAAKSESFTNHPLANTFRHQFVAAVKDIVADVNPSFIVKGSVGAGNWANVPWLSILDPEITKSTQEGCYPVYLFKADGSGVYLSLNQGTTTPVQRLGKRRAEQRAREFSDLVLTQVKGLAEWGDRHIDLLASTTLGKSYEVPNISAKYYSATDIPDTSTLQKDLVAMLDFYTKVKPFWLSFSRDDKSSASTERKKVESLRLPKPFLLLAGISGTGKTRFVRQQANLTGSLDETYCLVPVRPDWHEPSDLLGYITRLGGGPRYVVTEVLRFIVSAWKEVVAGIDRGDGHLDWIGKEIKRIRPFWLCLDEMNLAPVEQYFADFLSVLETRHFLNEDELQQFNADYGVERPYLYTCDPLLKPEVFAQLDPDGLRAFRKDLGLAEQRFDDLWEYFTVTGISLPFNLIVAGTVNMDETTHGFSRKVIDRALSIDFGEFFPNDFAQFFAPQSEPVALSYPLASEISRESLGEVAADPDGEKTIAFLADVNALLSGTPFELSYRALNELLLSVVSYGPEDEKSLQAVWDDFLMMKVLPRIEGDHEKLSVPGDPNTAAMQSESILDKLEERLQESMATIWDGTRPDLFRVSMADGSSPRIDCRTKAKIQWMRLRLQVNGYTSFWP